jgi:serine/threonine protein phosphatase PrpC
MSNAWYSFSVCDVGKKRSVNQDSIFSDDNQKIWVVADGMGGHRDGDKASQAIVSLFNKTTFSNVMSERLLQIEKGLRALNTELQNYSTNILNGQLIGSTMVALTVCQGVCAIIWAGDSRCYKISKGDISQMSWDHSYVDELLRSGHMVAEEAATSKLSNVITRALGAHEEVFFDHVICPYSDDDTFLLCSDGLTNELTDKTINELVSKKGCSQNDIDNLLAETLEHGAKDNVSIILISSSQRRPHNPHESNLVASYSQKLNTLADSLFNREIELDSYYPKMAGIIEQSITSHNSFKGQETQELPVMASMKEKKDSPTANFPKVTKREEIKPTLTKPEIIKPQFDNRYYFLLSAIVTLLLVLIYLVIN